MKKIILPVLFVLIAAISACNSSDKKHDHHNSKEPKTLTDSLEKDIDEGHIDGMKKIGRLHNTQKNVQRILDSLEKLPAKAKEAAAPYITELRNAIEGLSYADMAMDKWMMEYNMDSAKEDAQRRIDYLMNEKLKVDKMKDAINSSLAKADSLLNIKF